MEDKLFRVFNSVGVKLYDAEGRPKSVMDVLNDLANKWTNLSKEQKEQAVLASFRIF